MINQLINSSQQEKRFNRSRVSQQQSTPTPIKDNNRSGMAKIEEDSLSESQMPIRLEPVRDNSSFTANDSIWDIQHSIKHKLRQKAIHLPNISLSIHSPSPSTYKYAVKKGHTNKDNHYRYKTETNEEDLNQHYDKTIVEIKELNRHMERKDRRTKQYRRFYTQNYPDILEESAIRRRQRFNHISRQDQFEKYVGYLEDKHKYKRDLAQHGESYVEGEIEKRLKSRVATRKREYNPENLANSKNLLHSEGRGAPQASRVSQNKQGKTISTQSTQQSRVRRQNYGNVIKLLRLAKNRGQSLLVKLQKYPSEKRLA